MRNSNESDKKFQDHDKIKTYWYGSNITFIKYFDDSGIPDFMEE